MNKYEISLSSDNEMTDRDFDTLCLLIGKAIRHKASRFTVVTKAAVDSVINFNLDLNEREANLALITTEMDRNTKDRILRLINHDSLDSWTLNKLRN